MSAGLSMQSFEFVDEHHVSMTWADDDEFSEHHGEIHKAWIDLRQLPDFVSESLQSACEDLLDEYYTYKRNPPETISPRRRQEPNPT